MPRGGIRRRSNDGSLDHLIKPKWRSGQTRTIRVPVVLADQLLEIAHKLDEGESIELTEDNKADGEKTDTQLEVIAILQKADTSKNIAGMRRLLREALAILLMGG